MKGFINSEITNNSAREVIGQGLKVKILAKIKTSKFKSGYAYLVCSDSLIKGLDLLDSSLVTIIEDIPMLNED